MQLCAECIVVQNVVLNMLLKAKRRERHIHQGCKMTEKMLLGLEEESLMMVVHPEGEGEKNRLHKINLLSNFVVVIYLSLS